MKLIAMLLMLSLISPFYSYEKIEEGNEVIKDYSGEFLSAEGTYTDSVGNTYNYSYKIPEFTIPSEEALLINSVIKADFYSLYEQEKAFMTEGLSLTVLNISYEEYSKGDIASFLIKAVYDYDYTSYESYSLNIKNGKMVEFGDFLEMSGLPEEEFIGKIKKAAGNKYKEIYGNPEDNEYLMSAYEYTVSDEAVNMNIPMFIGENGNLFAVAKIGSVAGAAYYEHVIDTEIKVIK